MRAKLAGLRAPLLVAHAALLTALVASSSLLRLFPLPPGFLVAAAGLVLAAALVPAALTRSTPVPAVLAITVPVLAIASYDQSRLDWLRLLKDYGIVAHGAEDWARFGLEAATLALVWALHVADHALRLRWDAVARGVPEAQARAAARVAMGAGGRVLGAALLGAAALGALAWGAAQVVDANLVLGGRAAIVAPLLAVGILAAAAIVLAKGSEDSS